MENFLSHTWRNIKGMTGFILLKWWNLPENVLAHRGIIYFVPVNMWSHLHCTAYSFSCHHCGWVSIFHSMSEQWFGRKLFLQECRKNWSIVAIKAGKVENGFTYRYWYFIAHFNPCWAIAHKKKRLWLSWQRLEMPHITHPRQNSWPGMWVPHKW